MTLRLIIIIFLFNRSKYTGIDYAQQPYTTKWPYKEIDCINGLLNGKLLLHFKCYKRRTKRVIQNESTNRAEQFSETLKRPLQQRWSSSPFITGRKFITRQM